MDEQSHVVVAAILRHGARLLLCHRRPDRRWFPDVWDVPGGHVSVDEEPLAALARELHEELGVRLRPEDARMWATIMDDAHALKMTIWLVDHDGPVENRAPDEHDEIRWFTAEEITGLVLAHDDLRRDLLKATAEPKASR